MSNLQRKVLGGGAAGAALPMAAPRLSAPGVLPPTAPPTGRRRPGSFRRRSYSPVSWKKYWETKEQLKGGKDIINKPFHLRGPNLFQGSDLLILA